MSEEQLKKKKSTPPGFEPASYPNADRRHLTQLHGVQYPSFLKGYDSGA